MGAQRGIGFEFEELWRATEKTIKVRLPLVVMRKSEGEIGGVGESGGTNEPRSMMWELPAE